MEESNSLLTETAADTTPSAEANPAVVTDVTAATDTTPEAKPEGDKPAEAKTEAAKAEAKPEGAPEEYADFTAPEGMELDTEVLGDLKSIAKEMNLPQAQAQKIVDLGVKLQQKQAESWQAQIQKWVTDVKSDKEIGGDKLPENLSIAKKAIDSFGNQQIKSLLDSSGLGNHPDVIKMFVNIGKAISEDGFVNGNRNAGTSKSLEARLYGNSK